MNFFAKIIMISVVGICSTMLFSCGNTDKEIRDFLADKNLPMLKVNDVHLIHTDSGRVDVKLRAPLLKDFSNREQHPYTEFPDGVEIINIKKKDSIQIKGNYAISYSKTNISDIKGNVIIYNYVNKNKLKTSQIFWDQKSKIFFTEERFVLYTPTDTIPGRGFESDEGLKNWNFQNLRNGSVKVEEVID